ncbi:hypothetical protein IGI04_043013 [Brassica rapa subsp. trilocularis]|uniref:Uncharacterized protein n=1 Tax=Brassica rapa subsp. trilocularis TaxID=1813537 RepID=A0ABQ7KI05_BRACM|nr:hypothetical protein IGI04_043013 [Brassica rapa subsp. trilocularis]
MTMKLDHGNLFTVIMVPGLLSISSFLCFTLSSIQAWLSFTTLDVIAMDYASPWINVQSWQNTLNMCFALLNYPGRVP